MTDQTFHVTKEDLRKAESRDSKKHGGNIPADSDTSILKNTIQSIVDQQKNSSADPQSSLELPKDPPVPGDMKSADARYSNVGSGRFSGDVSTDPRRDPSTQGSAVREDGEKLHKETVV